MRGIDAVLRSTGAMPDFASGEADFAIGGYYVVSAPAPRQPIDQLIA